MALRRKLGRVFLLLMFGSDFILQFWFRKFLIVSKLTCGRKIIHCFLFDMSIMPFCYDNISLRLLLHCTCNIAEFLISSYAIVMSERSFSFLVMYVLGVHHDSFSRISSNYRLYLSPIVFSMSSIFCLHLFIFFGFLYKNGLFYIVP